MEQKIQSSDDISLHAVKESVLRFLFLVYYFTSGIIGFFRRHILIFAFSTLLFVGIGAGISFLVKKTYELRMTVVPSEFSRRIYSEQFVKLDKLIKTNSIAQLSKELKSGSEIVKQLSGITCYDIYDESLATDTSTKEREPFVVQVKVFNNTISDTLQTLLVNYINNNPFLSERKKIQYKIFEDKLLFVEAEQRKLDSLKAEYNLFMNNSGNKAMFYNNAFNPSDLYSKSNEYQYQKDQINSWFGFEQQPLRVIDGFKPARKADSLSLLQLLVISFFAGFIIASLIAGFKEISSLSTQER